MDRVDDGDDAVEMDAFVLAGELTDLYCDWSGERTARGFYYNPSWIILFWNQCQLRGVGDLSIRVMRLPFFRLGCNIDSH